MFAPDHDAAARELVRVCRPGGRIGLCCWTPESHFSRMLMIVSGHLPPPPPDFRPPALWGSEEHVGALLEPHGVTLEMRREMLSIRAPSPELQLAFFENAFGPFVTAKAALGDGWSAARQDVVDFVGSVNQADDGTLALELEYLETIGRRADYYQRAASYRRAGRVTSVRASVPGLRDGVLRRHPAASRFATQPEGDPFPTTSAAKRS